MKNLVLFIAILLTSCTTTQYQWVSDKQGAGQEEFLQASTDCKTMAVYKVGYNQGLTRSDVDDLRRQIFMRCMKENGGWSVQFYEAY